jgi:hypothetical protein
MLPPGSDRCFVGGNCGRDAARRHTGVNISAQDASNNLRAFRAQVLYNWSNTCSSKINDTSIAEWKGGERSAMKALVPAGAGPRPVR